MKASVKKDIETKWDVTGDDGTSRLSIILLRIMTTAFWLGTIYLVLLLSGLFDILSWPMPYQTLQMVGGMVVGFILLGLWAAISIHPLSGPPPKTLKYTMLIGYAFMALIGFGYFKPVSDFVSDWAINPLSLSFGIPFIIGAIGIIPITRLAWTMSPRLTDD